MDRNEYNGWTNRETWLINVWFNPETKSDIAGIREMFEEALDNIPDYLRDFIYSECINWQELEDALDSEDEDEDEDEEED
jgi:hypothetical protein